MLPKLMELCFNNVFAGRFMACSGGWDWAPYSRMRDIEGNPMLTRGIWKSVYLATSALRAAQIESFTPMVFHTGAVPTSVMADDGSATFSVNCTVHITCDPAHGASGTVAFVGEWPGVTTPSVPASCASGSGKGTVSVQLPATGVKLWWPRGMGGQSMYNVSAIFTPDVSGAVPVPVTASRRIGFRVATLTTGNDTDATWVAAHTSASANGNAVPAHTVTSRALLALWLHSLCLPTR